MLGVLKVADKKISENNLISEIGTLRNGYGCRSNISDANALITLFDNTDTEHLSSLLLELTLKYCPGPEGEALLAALNLLQGYEHLPSSEERRLQYYIDCKPNANLEDYKNNTVYKRELSSIKTLVERFMKAYVEDELEPIIEKAPRIPRIPKPRYTVKGKEERAAFETDEAINKIRDELVFQTDTLNVLEEAQDKTHEIVGTIAGYTKIIPDIAGGVDEANLKLDEIRKLSLRLDSLDSIAEAQASMGLNSIAYALFGENIMDIDPVEYEWRVQTIKEDLDNLIDRAIEDRLPEDALREIEEYPENGSHEGLTALIKEKMAEHGLDLHSIAFNITMRYIESYKRNKNASGIAEAEKAPAAKPLTTQPIKKPHSPATTTNDDLDTMTDEEKDKWLEDLLRS
jgi:hypothetical protein